MLNVVYQTSISDPLVIRKTWVVDLIKGIKNSWILQAVLIIITSLFIAGIGMFFTPYSFIQIMIVFDIIGGLIIAIYQVNESHSKTIAESGPTQNEEKDGEDELRTPPSEGLNVQERRIQNEIIEQAYQKFSENPYTAIFRRTSFVNEVADKLDVDEETVERVWKITRDDGFFEERRNAIHLAPLGIDRADELGERILIDEAIQDELLGILLQEYRNDPHHPRVDRSELIDVMDCPYDVVDHNVWMLDRKGYIDRHTYAGDDRGYRSIEITGLGRRVSE